MRRICAAVTLALATWLNANPDNLRALAAQGFSGGLGPQYTLQAKPDEILECRTPEGLKSGQKIAAVEFSSIDFSNCWLSHNARSARLRSL